MAFAWLIDIFLRAIPQPHNQTQKKRELSLLSVSGGRRKNPYNGDKLKARAKKREQ